MPMLNIVIDLSHHNQVTSFDDVRKAGIAGVIHKATQGRTFVDGEYHARRAQAHDAGLLWGAYHFGEGGDVKTQVDHFLDTVEPDATTLLVLDWEPGSQYPVMTRTDAEEFAGWVAGAVGRWPGLYSGQSFLHEQLGTETETPLRQCFLWVARYSSELPVVPPAWHTFSLWQYTDGSAGPEPHQVPGIGRCDRDKFQGTRIQLAHLWRRGTLPAEALRA